MNIAEQIRLKLQLKENSEVEFKSAAGGFTKAEFWRSFSALSNTNGGTIVLGVKEKNHSPLLKTEDIHPPKTGTPVHFSCFLVCQTHPTNVLTL